MKSFWNNAPDPLHSTLNSCFGVSRSVWMHFGLFCYCKMLDTKRAELVHLMKSSFHEVASEFFTMNRIDPPNWTLNSCFGVSRSVWVHLAMFHYFTKLVAKQVELVQLIQKFVHEVASEFFSTNAPNPPHWTLNSYFGASRSVWVHLAITLIHETRCKTG